MITFPEFNKIPRLNRNCTITEKIDGTNGVIHIEGDQILVGSRTRWITPEDDNFGFARWVDCNKQELLKLGPGTHYGEWWGGSIQRGYGLQEKRFSLFDTARWDDPLVRPACCGIVPVLYSGLFTTDVVGTAIERLKTLGSEAAPGFMEAEGVVIYHEAAGQMFKVTIKGDEKGKETEAHLKKERAPRPPKDPSKGGRRIAQMVFEGVDRRRNKL